MDFFRDIVAAAHLKPLDKTDKIGESFKQLWNPAAASDACQSSTSPKLPSTRQVCKQKQLTTTQLYLK